jgi:ElaB/YqjD/DUF883 family membrane-anchored ribosome-binding protein
MDHATLQARGAGVFNELVESIDELLKRMSDIDSPDTKKIRTKVQIALSAAKSAWQDTTQYANQRVTSSLRRPGDYLRESPWRALGIATVVGVGLGAFLTRQRSH